jgi:hypothetical protein
MKQQIRKFFLVEGQRSSRDIRIQERSTIPSIYDLLHDYNDPPTSAVKLKFYQRKLQQLHTQKTARNQVSRWELKPSLAERLSIYHLPKMLKRHQTITTLRSADGTK